MDANLTGSIVGVLTSLGLPGVIILALGYAYWRKDKRLDEVHESRISEARETTKTVEQNTNALETLSEVIRNKGTS